jgi:hypothetical protein
VEHLRLREQRRDELQVLSVAGGLVRPPGLPSAGGIVRLEAAEQLGVGAVPELLLGAVALKADPVLAEAVVEVGEDVRLRTTGDRRMAVEDQPQQGRAGARRADDEDRRRRTTD